jgi:hypothetical protein
MLLGFKCALCELSPLTCTSGLVLKRSFRPRLALSGPSCLRLTFIRSFLQGGCIWRFQVGRMGGRSTKFEECVATADLARLARGLVSLRLSLYPAQVLKISCCAAKRVAGKSGRSSVSGSRRASEESAFARLGRGEVVEQQHRRPEQRRGNPRSLGNGS